MGYILSIYQCVCKISSQYPTQFKRQGQFHFFRIWSSAKPRPMKNDISKSLGLYLENINVYAEVYQNIPLSSRDRDIFTFSEFGARQSLDWWYVSFCNNLTFFRIWTSAKTQPISNVIWQSQRVQLVNINVYVKFHHNIPLSSRDSAIITFSVFGARKSLDRR